MTKKLKFIILTMGLFGMVALSNSIAFGMNNEKIDITLDREDKMYDNFVIIGDDPFYEDITNSEIKMNKLSKSEINNVNINYDENYIESSNSPRINRPFDMTMYEYGGPQAFNFQNIDTEKIKELLNNLKLDLNTIELVNKDKLNEQYEQKKEGIEKKIIEFGKNFQENEKEYDFFSVTLTEVRDDYENITLYFNFEKKDDEIFLNATIGLNNFLDK